VSRASHSAIFNGCFELRAFSDSASERLHIALKISFFLLKQIGKQIGCGSTGPKQYSAWNLRQSLSPKAKPWDSDSADQGKRQACLPAVPVAGLAASVKRAVTLLPSSDFLISCLSCKSCQRPSFVFSATSAARATLGSGREITVHAFSTSRNLSGSRRAKIAAPGQGATSFFLCSAPRT
jgi:hypothetical protein